MSKTVRWIVRHLEWPLNNLLGLIRQLEEYLGPEDDWVEDDRRILFEAFNGFLGYKTIYDIDERGYVTTAAVDPDRCEEILYEHGYRRNLLSGRKRRDTSGGKQYAKSSWGYYYDNDQYQHHVFIFPAPDDRTDIYAHTEDNVTDSAAHLHIDDDEDDIKGLQFATPRDLYTIFDKEDIEYNTRDI